MDRRLAAILAADVVGYSRLMGLDEVGTLQQLKSIRAEIIDPKITEHRGRVFKSTGDGTLAEFPSVVSAVACAVEIQTIMQRPKATSPPKETISLRIGVHVGDVIAEGEDVFGDGVNVAARLEGIAPPNCIAVSAVVREHVGNRLDLNFEDMGEQQLKNIGRPVHVFHISVGKSMPAEQLKLALPSKPSIAVLPFINMSTEPEQETFADGLTEDLITDLSRNENLFVIARHSSFVYKGKSVDARRIASDLGVRYLIEGSVRRALNRVRINVQLIDAAGGGHLWAERFDRNLEDVFAVQDELTIKIVEALSGRLTMSLPRSRPKNLEAYELCVRVRSLTGQSPETAREAELLINRALALDSEYAEAHRWLAMILWNKWALWREPEEPYRRLSVAAAENSVALDPADAGNHWVLGYLLAYERRWSESEAAFGTALKIDPNNADARAMLADVSVFNDRPLEGIEQAQRAFRLNPHPAPWYYWTMGIAQYAAMQYDAAVSTLRNPATYRTASRRLLAANLAQLGRIDEARQEAALFMASNPLFRISEWAATEPFRNQDTCAHFIEGYRRAGLPE